ncbi:Choline/ethanolaminephosphotransferase 2 [Neolecta irregularis DAH-3]|uniref:Choline/ethanolaminephosphotransferase 2 n=1 Tax=Neolecta irregularis (strain DAH-3) TaxID=1198029 RepID=A0A1U7LJE1_NEOID|nr:Choline/ethanolaminephosphotransferase 2 [Neolecta irregularis DAH-3]|eukprot:OLL22713.1 Choline/ethanolaminephosphotransferase 2 [Neolecta irregularis DAH-3]
MKLSTDTTPVLLSKANRKNPDEARAECVSLEALEHLKSYQYRGVDKSPISNYILRPYWNAVTQLFPLWVAYLPPFSLRGRFVLLDLLFAFIWIPDLVGPGPRWLYWAFPAGLWLYNNVDGKQARRTKSSSPLGELFDHGIDSLNCLFGIVSFGSAYV